MCVVRRHSGGCFFPVNPSPPPPPRPCVAQVSKWRLQYREAEARLAELMGGKAGDAKTLVWGVNDEERFRGELDETVRACRGASCVVRSTGSRRSSLAGPKVGNGGYG